MAVSASYTAVILSRGSLLILYVCAVLGLLYASDYLTKPSFLAKNVSSHDVIHVARRGFGQWAKIRKGSFITKLNGKSSNNVAKKTVNEDLAAVEVNSRSNEKVSVPTKLPSAISQTNTSSKYKSKKVNRLPDCLIIGVRKAGTRVVLHTLRYHPDIKGNLLETGFFSKKEKFENLGTDWYIHQLPPVRQRDVLIEKCAEYFHHAEVPERVYKVNPRMKIILIVRDPFERLLSDYYFIRRYARTLNTSAQFKELENTIEELCIDKDGNITGFSGIVRSRYWKHMEHWLKTFPRSQFLVVDGDQFSQENPIGELKKLEDFLGVQPFFEKDSFYFNATKGFYCNRWSGCLGSEKGHVHPRPDPDFEHTLRNHFKRHNEIFYAMVGRNFDWRTW